MKEKAQKFMKKGIEIVQMNEKAIDAGANAYVKVDVPAAWATAVDTAAPAKLEGREKLVKMVETIMNPVGKMQGDSLKVLNNDDQVNLPAWIYTANSCVLGWSAEKDAEKYDYRVMTYGGELYEKLQDTQKLYAVWGDAEQCVESARYARVKAVAENGRIELLEGEGEPRVHRFGTDGSIILPPEQYTGGFRVRAIPDDGYVLEKILLIQDGDTIPFENGEWLEGLVDGAEIRAYFIESAEPVVTDGAKFYQSGNAVRFTFHKDGFVKDGKASIRISLENDDGKELDGNEYRCSKCSRDFRRKYL